ncbi:PITH domain-containing protein [Entamoeba marina]
MNSVDLLDCIDQKNFEVLNCKDFKHAFKVFSGKGKVISDVDEQLLIKIGFLQPVTLHSITFKAPSNGTGPNTVMLYANRNDIAFDDVDCVKSTAILKLTEDDYKKPITLQSSLFSNLRCITLFIKDNRKNGYVTEIDNIKLLGCSTKTANLSELRPVCCCACKKTMK